MIDLDQYIRDVPNFPSQGIMFKDITPLLADPNASASCVSMLAKSLREKRIDKVIGIEARGFFFGSRLAAELNVGFIPIRKKGKLPHKTLSQSYGLEYGEDQIEIHADSIQPGDSVVLHDDVLATGGTMEAAIKIVEKLGGEVVQCNFLLELSFLNGRDRIEKFSIHSLKQY
ncbi:adenine phosphoribosyltransferase [Gangjinia marincola]|uniref:Adenine phosphoribosyltransferase n=1 Tax=Gangjinia marincola TaxID=578463 RepID=A0ABN1MKC9_9FLAO